MIKKHTSAVSFTILDYIFAVLIAFFAGVIPLIVKYYLAPTAPEQQMYLNGITEFADLFSFNKGQSIIFTAVTALIVLLVKIYIEHGITSVLKRLRSPLGLLTLGYCFFVVISSIFSEYSFTVLNGFSERYESVWVLLGYIIMFAVALDFTVSVKHMKVIIYAVLISSCLVGLVGVLQYFDMDPITAIEFTKKLILGEHYEAFKSGLEVKFESIYSTLYNPNCVGMYVSVLIPLSFIPSLMLPVKSVLKYICLAISALMFFLLIGCQSRGGVVAVGVTLVVALIVNLIPVIRAGEIKKSYKSLAIYAAIAVIVFGGVIALLNPATSEVFINRLKSITRIQTGPSPYFVKDLVMAKNTVTIMTAAGDLNISNTGDEFMLMDGDMIPLHPDSASEDPENGAVVYKYKLDGFKKLEITSVQEFLLVSMGDIKLVVGREEDGDIALFSALGVQIDPTEHIQRFGFDGMELFASSRGYIWSRSLPMLVNRLLIGSGPDTFAYEFPQHDIMGKIHSYGDPYIIVDKPHQMYLQTGVNTGMLSMLIIIAIFAYYIFRSFKIIILRQLPKGIDGSDFFYAFYPAVVAANIGYMLAGLTTDSTVSVAPVFWVLLGVGFALNNIVERESNITYSHEV